MGVIRGIKTVLTGKPAIEGAGVHLKRAFGNSEAPLFDPFLLLDDFHSDTPADYVRGFPWHPHRGIETITYVLNGEIDHGDSMGNKGIIQSGDIQWMTAGSGIIHQEMPVDQRQGLLWGFQIWTNLPSSHKMMPPRYRDVKSGQIPRVVTDHGVTVKIICGEFNGTEGPVRDIVTAPEYLDIAVPPESQFRYATNRGRTVLAYVMEGMAHFDAERKSLSRSEHLIAFAEGDEVLVSTREKPVRFLLISGQPIKEPVAWYGPIVMNTREELKTAFEEYQNGTFLKHS
ncbi:MAG: pirin family protein [Dehalococcoidia bacterium]|nr:pirin family protein [Dehalococcoidia bacterium]